MQQDGTPTAIKTMFQIYIIYIIYLYILGCQTTALYVQLENKCVELLES